MFCKAAPDGDWALADDQMLDRQIAAKVIRREKTILLPLSGPSASDFGGSWFDRVFPTVLGNDLDGGIRTPR